MPKMIQICNVPDELHRTPKVRAAKAGMTLSDYLHSEIEQIAQKPNLRELMDRLAHDEPVELSTWVNKAKIEGEAKVYCLAPTRWVDPTLLVGGRAFRALPRPRLPGYVSGRLLPHQPRYPALL
jgi:plasmid stability protein